MRREVAVFCEDVLVVPRSMILPPVGEAFLGISGEDSDLLYACIKQHSCFMDRASAENDERYKQIIPYFVFHIYNKLFVMQRSNNANEKRLAGKLTLGIGGHVRAEDIQQEGSLFDWGLREFSEEVAYAGSLRGELLGFINDDTNAVGRVHLGAVFLLHGDSQEIAIRSELVSGTLIEFPECLLKKEAMESWSSLVCDALAIRFTELGTLAPVSSGKIIAWDAQKTI